MESGHPAEILRRIPSVEHLLQQPELAHFVIRTSHAFVVSEIQRHLAGVRERIRAGAEIGETPFDPDALVLEIVRRIEDRLRPCLRPLINATGVIIHTNLGRSPLSKAAQASLSAVGELYSNLEYDLVGGRRSQRDQTVEDLCREVLGCAAVTVVNNNAAAVLLALNTLACGREVVVSRGELVEIGGSFRIPEIMEKSGALLREVGTTNKTRIEDYRAAISSGTALLLRVHPSNFRIRGFTQRPELSELVELAHANGLPLFEDIGSGCLIDLRRYGIQGEPVAGESLAAGVDLISFSGDKLMGGPQAGILAGSRDHIGRIRRNPLMRTYRVDKLIYAALEATLSSYRNGRALEEIPVLQMISLPYDELQERGRRFLRRLRPRLGEGASAAQVRGESLVGGGSCPEERLATPLIVLQARVRSAGEIEQRLRAQDPPIIVRLEDDNVLIDLRTIFSFQEGALLEGVQAALT